MSSGLDGLVRNIGIISRNNSVLASLIAQMDSENTDEPGELRILLQDTSALARETGEQLLRMQGEASPQDMPPRQRVTTNPNIGL